MQSIYGVARTQLRAQSADLIVALQGAFVISKVCQTSCELCQRSRNKHQVNLASLARDSAWIASYECRRFRHNQSQIAVDFETKPRCCRSRLMRMAPPAGCNLPAD